MSSNAGYNHGQQPASMRPHLVVKLKPGWSYDLKRSLFAAAGDETFSPWADLPKGVSIVHMTPDLAGKPPESLSKDEQDLIQYLQVIFPKGARPEDYMRVVDGWKCIDKVSLPPEISLP